MLLHLNPCQRDSEGTQELHPDKPACQLLPQHKKQPFCFRKSDKVRNSTFPFVLPLCPVLGVGPSLPNPEILVSLTLSVG